MKNKVALISLILIMAISLTGCDKTKTLKCNTTSSEDGRNSTSDLEVKVKKGEVKDMTLTLNVEIPNGGQTYKQAMMNQIRQKTEKVYITEKGLKAIFDMDSSYFNALGVSKDASFSEIKQVLELQGYTCEE